MFMYCVMICDVKGSRALVDWPIIVGRIEKVLKNINSIFHDEVCIDFKLTVGDEFQGVLKTPKNAYDLYLYIKSNLPVEVYCGIGIGDIEKPNNKDTGMRGAAFYRAREALEFCKKKKRGVFLKSDERKNQVDDIINTMFLFFETIERSWTKRQKEIVSYYRLHSDYTYEEIGKKFGISRQSVYQILKSANWHIVLEGESLIQRLLMGFVKDNYLTGDSKANMPYRGEESC